MGAFDFFMSDIFKKKARLDRPYFCPQCGAKLGDSKEYSIEWVDDKKEFIVKIAFHCPSCGKFEDNSLSLLPLTIAQESSCSCGSTLSLSNHKIQRVGDEIIFEGTYFCKSCGKSDHIEIKDLKHEVLKVWENTKSIEVGPTGMKYEKQDRT